MSRILIAGCGFLGEAAAFQLQGKGMEVAAMVATPESAALLRHKGLSCCSLDLSSPEELSDFAKSNGPFDLWIHCASSGGGGEDAYRKIYLEGARNLLHFLPSSRPIFIGSTSIYAQTGGEWVDEESCTEPDRATGRILLEAEKLVLNAGGIVARLAGIYGPGRSVQLRKFLSGEARIEGEGTRWINQIHRDDGASAIVHLASTKGSQGIYNVSDLHPWQQIDFFTELSKRLALPLPPPGIPNLHRKRGWTNKRVSSQKIQALGWKPLFPDYFDALPELLPADLQTASAGKQ